VSASREVPVRVATAGDAPIAARLLHDFNSEYDEYTPGTEALAERARELIEAGEVTILLGGEDDVGLVQLRFRPSIWSDSLEAYLQELYVAPAHRGRGIGRALLEMAIDLARDRGASSIDLGTSVDDVAAIGLYESAGFTNREGRADGPSMLFYEREL
jgi:ribosomal protein S18 acetylase RimI-like enzyme